MIAKPSSSLQSDYDAISELAHETGEPVYFTKNGDIDLVVMSIEAFERGRTVLEQRAAVLEAETRRFAGEVTYSVREARAMLKERYAGK